MKIVSFLFFLQALSLVSAFGMEFKDINGTPTTVEVTMLGIEEKSGRHPVETYQVKKMWREELFMCFEIVKGKSTVKKCQRMAGLSEQLFVYAEAGLIKKINLYRPPNMINTLTPTRHDKYVELITGHNVFLDDGKLLDCLDVDMLEDACLAEVGAPDRYNKPRFKNYGIDGKVDFLWEEVYGSVIAEKDELQFKSLMKDRKLTKEILFQFMQGKFSGPNPASRDGLSKSIAELENINKEGTGIKYVKNCPGALNEEVDEDPTDIENRKSATRRLINGW
jgi:hypothetical protein